MSLINPSEIKDRTVILEINNPPLNIITIKLTEELSSQLDKYSKLRDINTILIRGSGKCFSAGADIKEHLPENVTNMLMSFKKLLVKILLCPKITVSSVHGYALGGGLELALATDFCLATDDARFSLPEITLAMFPPIATAWLPYLTGFRNANKITLTGCELNAQTLKEMGVINNITNLSEKEMYESEFCSKFSKMSMSAIETGKKSMKLFREALMQSLDYSINLYLTELTNKQDSLEGINAFIEKRKPVWTHT